MLERARLIRAGLDKMAANVKELRKYELFDSDWRNVDEVDDSFYPFLLFQNTWKVPIIRPDISFSFLIILLQSAKSVKKVQRPSCR